MSAKTVVIPADAGIHPLSVFRKFFGRPGLFFLDSSQPGKEAAHSYIGFSPYKTVSGTGFAQLRRALKNHRRRGRAGLSWGGAVGYIGYEGHFHFGFYDQIITFDHRQNRIMVNTAVPRHTGEICRTLAKPAADAPSLRPLPQAIAYKSNFNRTEYVKAVRKTLQHIRQGDIYQINLSRVIEASLRWRKYADPTAVYSALRKNSPSPFAAYFDDGKQIILSSSPERFLKLSNGIVQVKPMKGTRPRGRTAAQDRRFRQDLRKSAKEIAELLMVTDLERNDLGRVCQYGSVKVKSRRTIEEYKTVFQATATIEGKLRPDKDPCDALEAAFPSGSVTGCPKIEAMKIIRNLEGRPRGPYTGALGYIDFAGNMDFSVLIRSIFLRPGGISFHVGGGIVADSDPAAEYEETCVKAQAMQAALNEVLHA